MPRKKEVEQDAHKTVRLIVSIVIDLIGMGSYLVLGGGEFTDFFFAPMQAAWIYFAYRSGTFAILGGLEEILPFTDFIPSCTIIHFLHYRKKTKK